MNQILVIAAGNELAGDDGAGPIAARLLQQKASPGLFRIEEVHTNILALGRLWRGESAVWIIDAMLRGGRPGDLYDLDHKELLRIPQGHRHAHSLSLPENLRWLLIGKPEMRSVRFRAWGIEAETVGRGETLSSPVARAVPVLARKILQEATLMTREH